MPRLRAKPPHALPLGDKRHQLVAGAPCEDIESSPAMSPGPRPRARGRSNAAGAGNHTDHTRGHGNSGGTPASAAEQPLTMSSKMSSMFASWYCMTGCGASQPDHCSAL